MGNRIDGFDIVLTFDSQGHVRTAEYRDSEGCGAEKEFGLGTVLADVVGYHLDHYRVSHKRVPKRSCPVSITATLGVLDQVVLRCTEDRNHDGDHLFAMGHLS